jgi:hypothetical protein
VVVAARKVAARKQVRALGEASRRKRDNSRQACGRPAPPSHSLLHTARPSHKLPCPSYPQVACSRTLVAKKGHEEDVAKLCGDIMRFTTADSPVQKQILEYQCVRDSWEVSPAFRRSCGCGIVPA